MVEEDRALRVREIERPEPGEGQVRVKVAACGICGSDLHMRTSSSLPAGTILGHEFAGEVEAVGSGVEGVSHGDRVCVHPGPPLERHDFQRAMATGIGLGRRPGAYAEAVVVDAEMLWPLPDHVSFEHAALTEPVAVAVHALRMGDASLEAHTAVVGAGPIGMLVALVAKAWNIDSLVVIEPNEARREAMESMGVRAVGLDNPQRAVREAIGGDPTLVLECAGHPSAPDLAVQLVAAEGTVVLVGALDEPVEISQIALIAKEAQIRASFSYRPADFTDALDLIASGAMPADRLITAVEPLERAADMFDELRRPGSPQVKVILRP